MAAAVADFRPWNPAAPSQERPDGGSQPIRSREPRHPRRAGRRAAPASRGRVRAETGDAQHRRPGVRGGPRPGGKGADLLVLNDVGGGRASAPPDNAVTILDGAGEVRRRGRPDRRTRSPTRCGTRVAACSDVSGIAPRWRPAGGVVAARGGRLATGGLAVSALTPDDARSLASVPSIAAPALTLGVMTSADLRLFTSESVTEGQPPTRSATRFSDAILDALLEQDPAARVAVETMVTTGLVHVAGEVTTSAYVEPGYRRNKLEWPRRAPVARMPLVPACHAYRSSCHCSIAMFRLRGPAGGLRGEPLICVDVFPGRRGRTLAAFAICHIRRTKGAAVPQRRRIRGHRRWLSRRHRSEQLLARCPARHQRSYRRGHSAASAGPRCGDPGCARRRGWR